MHTDVLRRAVRYYEGDIPASDRNIGFVFQSYALFRYMTVYDNIAFGLRVKKTPEKEIKELEEKQIAIATMYTQTEEGETEIADIAEGDTPAEGSITDSTGETTESTPKWMSYAIDPSPGYRVDPVTGERYYADTGEPVSESSLLDDDVPVNANIISLQDLAEGIE